MLQQCRLLWLANPPVRFEGWPLRVMWGDPLVAQPTQQINNAYESRCSS